MSLTIMQGDQYAIPFVGKLNGEPLDLTKIEQIEFVVGPLRKVYPGEVTTDEHRRRPLRSKRPCSPGRCA